MPEQIFPHTYGWRPPLPDLRDYRFNHFDVLQEIGTLPTHVDMRAQMPPVYNQLQLGSCTANSIGGGVQFLQAKQGLNALMPSRLFIYLQERIDDGDVGQDAGSSIRESCKAVAKYGVPPEILWPYDISKFGMIPPDSVYAAALQTRVSQYLAVAQTGDAMKACLASGYPIHVGFSVYTSFESQAVALNGTVPMPGPGEQLLGGHAVMVVGYDDTQQRWICRNSWGTDWGQLGYFSMPYAYLLNPGLASDFWTLRMVTGPTPPPPAPAPHKTGQMNVYSDGSIQWVALANVATDNWVADFTNSAPDHSH